jgi:hypothetical protein
MRLLFLFFGGAIHMSPFPAAPGQPARWPVSSVYVLGLFLGIDLVIAGASWIGIGLD